MKKWLFFLILFASIAFSSVSCSKMTAPSAGVHLNNDCCPPGSTDDPDYPEDQLDNDDDGNSQDDDGNNDSGDQGGN